MVSVLNDLYPSIYFISYLIRSEFAKIQHNCLTKTEAYIIYTWQLFTSTYYKFALHIKQITNETYIIMSIQKLSYYST